MSLKNDSPPSPPSVSSTAGQQLDYSKQAANYNAGLSRYGQYTPYGSSTWVQTGTDQSGAPTYANVQQLSPQQQQLYNQQMQQANQLNTIGGNMMGQISKNLSSPLPDFNQSYQQAYQANYNRGALNLDPQYKNLKNDLDVQLANQGVMPGSAAYQRAQDQFARERDYAYNQLTNSAQANAGQTQQQAIANALQLQNAPLQQLMAIRQGTQVANPSFSNQFNAPQISTPNTADMAYRNYAAQQDAYNQQVAQNNNMMNGLMGLGSAWLLS